MSLKQDLATELGVTPAIHRGPWGSFDVYLDGTLIFSKQQTGRLPSASEIRACIAAVQKRPQP